MLLAHQIELKPNNKQATYFAKACGVSRFAYNWALDQWKQQYQAGEKPTEASLRRQLNGIKHKEFPWMAEVSKNAPQKRRTAIDKAIATKTFLLSIFHIPFFWH